MNKFTFVDPPPSNASKMTIVELKRRDGKPLYCFVESVSFWTEAVDNSNHTEINIGGQKWYLNQPIAEVDKIIREA